MPVDTSQVYVTHTTKEVPAGTSDDVLIPVRYRLEIVLADTDPLTEYSVNPFDGLLQFTLHEEELRTEHKEDVVVGQPSYPSLRLKLRWDLMPQNLRDGLLTHSGVQADVDGSTVQLTSFWTLYSDEGDSELSEADWPPVFMGVHPREDLTKLEADREGVTIEVTLADAVKTTFQNVQLLAVSQSLFTKTDEETTGNPTYDANQVFQVLVDQGNWRYGYVQDDPDTEVRLVSFGDLISEIDLHVSAMFAALSRRGSGSDWPVEWSMNFAPYTAHFNGYESNYGSTTNRGSSRSFGSTLLCLYRKDRSASAGDYYSWWGGLFGWRDEASWVNRMRNVYAWMEWFIPWMLLRARPRADLDTGEGTMTVSLYTLPFAEWTTLQLVTVNTSQMVGKTFTVERGAADVQRATAQIVGLSSPDLENGEFLWNDVNPKGKEYSVDAELHAVPSVMLNSIFDGRNITNVDELQGPDRFKWGGYSIDIHALYYATGTVGGITTTNVIHRLFDIDLHRTITAGILTSSQMQIFLPNGGFPGAYGTNTQSVYESDFLLPIAQGILDAQYNVNSDVNKWCRQIIAVYGRRPALYEADGSTLGTAVIEFTTSPMVVSPGGIGRHIRIRHDGVGPTGLAEMLSPWNVPGTAAGEIDARGFISNITKDTDDRVKVRAVIVDPSIL